MSTKKEETQEVKPQPPVDLNTMLTTLTLLLANSRIAEHRAGRDEYGEGRNE